MTPADSTPAAAPGAHLLHARVRSWDELVVLLQDDWLSLRDGRDRELLRVRDGLGLVEHPGRLRARERRGLHRCGFRRQHAEGVRMWVWAPPGDPLLDPRDLPAALRRWQERDEVLRAQAVRTVRDVLGAQPHDVSVVLLPEQEDDAWDDRDRDPSRCRAGPCPCDV
jgi:hypothetical protein